MKPFTKRSDFKGRGGQKCIEVVCLYDKCLFVTTYTICGQPYISLYCNDAWFVGVVEDNISRLLSDSTSLEDHGIGEEPRYNLNVMFPFSSRLLAKLQEFVDKKDYDGYLSFVSQALSGEDKEKWDEYCDTRLGIEASTFAEYDHYDFPGLDE